MSEFIVSSVKKTDSSDLGAATGETSVTETSSAGKPALTGQAAALMTLAPPAPGETIVVAPQSGATYVLDFGPREASVSTEGGNLVLSFDDSGDGAADRQIVFEDIAQLAEAGEAPTLQIAGTSFSADTLFNEAQALAGEAAPLETAAADGVDALGGGATAYSDNLGDVIKLLQALGVIPPTELEFGLIDLEEDTGLVLLGEDLPSAPEELVINEIGLGVSFGALPGIPGEPEVPDGVRLDFIEFYNAATSAVETLDLTVELLNPAGDVVTMGIPDGLVIPAGGFLVIYEQSAAGEGGLETTVFGVVFDAEGVQLDVFLLPGVAPWALGEDTTEALAVNLVFQAGTETETGVDTFAANLPAADLGVLSSPTWVPNETVSELFPNANFETFLGNFTPGQNIFSRVFDNGQNDPASGAPLDSDTEADWTTNNTQTAGSLNDTDLTEEGALVLNHGANPGVFHVSLDGSVTEVVTEADVLAAGETDVAFINNGIALASDGTVYFTNGGTGIGDGAIMQRLPDGTVEVLISEENVAAAIPEMQVVLQDLIVGDDGLLYVVDEENDAILSIDPGTLAVSVLTSAADILGLAEFGTINDLGGLILSADGTTLYLAVDGDPNNGIVQIDVSTGVPSVLATDAVFDSLSVFMVLAPNGDLIVADESGGDELYRVTPGGDVSVFLSSAELDAATNASTDLEAGFWFDADGNFYLADGQTQTVYRFDAVDPVTGEVDALGYPLALEADIIAALGAADLQGGAVFLPTSDANPSDFFFDDTNPQQANGDPLAGQSVQVADSDAGVLMEGFGGPDALFGGAGGDTIYGGSQAMVAEQGALNTEDPGEAPANGFSDHNDFLFGDAGDDAIYGGSGSDVVVGGLGADSIDGGSGGDLIAGHDVEGQGVPEGDPGAPELNADVIAGDGLNNIADGDAVTVAEALVNLGGDDSILGGFGFNLIAGDALALNEEGDATSQVRNDDEVSFPDPNGNDLIYGGESGNIIAGEALARGLGTAGAEADNYALLGGLVGSDSIVAAEGSNLLSGEAVATAIGGSDAYAYVTNTAEVGSAGNDLIGAGDGADSIAGEAAATSIGSFATVEVVQSATGPVAEAGNDVIEGGAGSDDLAGESLAISDTQADASVDNAAADGGATGGDTITGDQGADAMAGEALARGANSGTAYVILTAEDEGDSGSDSLVGGNGADSIAGEGLAFSETNAVGFLNTDASSGGVLANDTISGNAGSDFLAGEILVLSQGEATIIGNLVAEGNGSEAGNDDLTAGGSADDVAGDILVDAVNDISVEMNSMATEGAVAAGDTVGGGAGADVLSGDVIARSSVGVVDVEVIHAAVAAAANANAGFDSIQGGNGANIMAGDALVEGGDGSSVTVESSIDGEGFVGSDVLLASDGDNQIAGDALVIAEGASTVLVDNRIITGGPTANVGSDVIEVGTGENVIAGDALGFGGPGLSVTVGNVADDEGAVGNDGILAGNGNNRIAGDALIIGGGDASVTNTNSAVVQEDARVGNDSIEVGDGSDTLSGDVMAFDGGTAFVFNSGDSGNDVIIGGNGENFIAGDALAAGAGGLAEVGGEGSNDTIFGGDQADLIAGDALGIQGATVDISDGGDDSILAGDGDDTVYGDGNGTEANGGDDTIDGGAGNDSLFGNSGDDVIFGGDDNDFIDGEIGDDTLDGGDGNDGVSGNAGNDVLFGGAGDDTLNGGTGDDTIDGGAGVDQIFGGSGVDVIVFDADDEAGGSVNADIDDGFNAAFSGDFLVIDEDVDFTALNEGVWTQFEILDLENGGADTDETLTLNVDDVIDLTDFNNLLSIQGGAVGLNAGVGAGDTVNLNGGGAGSNWDAGVDQGDYTLYTNDNGALVAIDNDVAVMVANA